MNNKLKQMWKYIQQTETFVLQIILSLKCVAKPKKLGNTALENYFAYSKIIVI